MWLFWTCASTLGSIWGLKLTSYTSSYIHRCTFSVYLPVWTLFTGMKQDSHSELIENQMLTVAAIVTVFLQVSYTTFERLQQHFATLQIGGGAVSHQVSWRHLTVLLVFSNSWVNSFLWSLRKTFPTLAESFFLAIETFITQTVNYGGKWSSPYRLVDLPLLSKFDLIQFYVKN